MGRGEFGEGGCAVLDLDVFEVVWEGMFGGIEGWRFRLRTRSPVAAATGLLISVPLLFLKAAIAKLQCPAVLGDDAHHSVRCAVGYVGLDLKGQRHIGAGQAGQV